ncbi:Ras GTPase [Steccherinum ochraceum]|uniref:Ras GTPase n=1 Tax=Steccherinum ochraceum TaxID=92696 RepID=A0A4R0RVJ2_9APHY|nr:Ras GTPase [Steccherinum ochraceum]
MGVGGVVYIKQMGVPGKPPPRVGKRSLLWRYDTNIFPELIDPVIQVTTWKAGTFEDQPMFLDVFDCYDNPEPSYRNPRMLENACKEGDGFLLVYSVDSRQSLDAIQTFLDEISQWRDGAEGGRGMPPLVVVGNKCDLKGGEREVSFRDGQQVADKLGAGFFEVSAKEGVNVREPYEEVARRVLTRRWHPTATQPSRSAASNVKSKRYSSMKCLIA